MRTSIRAGAALFGDVIAGLGARNGWSGVVINGAVRDSAVLQEIDFGVPRLAAFMWHREAEEILPKGSDASTESLGHRCVYARENHQGGIILEPAAPSADVLARAMGRFDFQGVLIFLVLAVATVKRT